jgi:hypothetical protein
MTASRDPDRLIHAFLLEGEEQLYDQVYDAVRAEIEQKRQRVLIGPWRTPIMNRFVRIGLAAAAVVLIALVGYQYLGKSNTGGPGPSQSAESSHAPSAAPPSGEPSAWVGLPAGPHELGHGTGISITVTIAAPDWNGTPGEGYVQWGPTGAEGPSGAGMIGFTEGEYYVYGDACAWSSTRPDASATTVDGLIAALANQASRVASVPEDITVDGHTGKKIILHMAEGIAGFAACDKDSQGDAQFGLFAVPPDVQGPARYSQSVGQIEEVWGVDVDGHLVVNIGAYYPETPQNAVDEVRAILASATFQ